MNILESCVKWDTQMQRLPNSPDMDITAYWNCLALSRKKSRKNLGLALEKFAEDCTEVATMDKEPKLDGRHMTMFLSCRQNKDAKKETKK